MQQVRIVIDVTNLVDVHFVSGIQRVVREIVTRLVVNSQSADADLFLIAYSLKNMSFFRIPNKKFLACYQQKEFPATELRVGMPFSFQELNPGDIFFDIDSVWNNRIKRSFLLPILKERGIKIAVHIYDIIPILFPHYCEEQTTLRFMDYLGATLINADLIIANTKSTLRDIDVLIKDTGAKPIKHTCVPLGANFHKNQRGSDNNLVPYPISEKLKKIKEKDYILMVGTIEPRKNHGFILDAYQQSLKKEGIGLVFAGRPGWNVDDLLKDIRMLDDADESFIYLDQADDQTIQYLYEHAFFTVFPTQYEGFGLPIIESFMQGTPVIASDIPVLREVGGDLCDYFRPNDCEHLLEILLKYKKSVEQYESRKAAITQYRPFSWDQSAEAMWDAISQLWLD